MTRALAALTLLALQQEKHDCSLRPRPAAGARTQISRLDRWSLEMTVGSGKQALRVRERRSSTFKSVEEILELREGKVSKSSWTFKTATRDPEQNLPPFGPYGFEGKTVVLTALPDGTALFAYDGGGRLGPDDLQGMRDVAVWAHRPRKDQPGAAETLSASERVAVGGTWTPEWGALAAWLCRGMSVDPKKSEGALTLKSAEAKEGAPVGRVEGRLTLSVTEMGAMKFAKALAMVVTVELEGSLDGRRPEGRWKVTARLKGTTEFTREGTEGKSPVEVDLTSAIEEERAAAK
jgi:hypothetical protein